MTEPRAAKRHFVEHESPLIFTDPDERRLAEISVPILFPKDQSMSATEIMAELPKLSPRERRRILDRILELDDEAEMLEERRHLADESFQMLDALEAEDAQNAAR